MPICVKSEIGPLKRVLLQRPGRELEHLSPNTMGQLLFDDIPYLYGAQREHDCFAQILRDNGAEVVYLEDLTAQVLAGDEELRRRFVEETIRRAGSTAMGYRGDLKRYLLDIQDPLELVLKTMEGVSYQDVFPNEQGRLSSLVHTGARFLMPPIPNLYFTRDPFACIGRGVSLNHMFTDTRNRETLYGDYVLRHHPDYAGQVPLYYTPDQYFWIEGGDILNLSRRVLGVGISQRTQPEAIEQLASAIFADESSEIDTVLAFEIPSTRAFMHLDTVFTQIDVDKYTVHPAILGPLTVYEITPGKDDPADLQIKRVDSDLEHILEHYTHVDKVHLIYCGGDDLIAAAREQWNDGSNTLCIAPGKIVVYQRNDVTNAILRDAGITVLEMPSAELSRGRGGPRCMSMPLIRAE